MKLIDARTIPLPPVWSGHTDKDLVASVRHYFPNPGPLLAELIERFEMTVVSRVEDEGPEEANCPACGTALKLDHP